MGNPKDINVLSDEERAAEIERAEESLLYDLDQEHPGYSEWLATFRRVIAEHKGDIDLIDAEAMVEYFNPRLSDADLITLFNRECVDEFECTSCFEVCNCGCVR